MSVPIDYAGVTEQDANYWLAQMDKPQIYAAVAALHGDCPTSVYASHESLQHTLQKYCNVQVVIGSANSQRDRVHNAIAINSVCVQFRHGDNDWSRGSPELVVKPSNIGFVNIAAYLLLSKKEPAQ